MQVKGGGQMTDRIAELERQLTDIRKGSGAYGNLCSIAEDAIALLKEQQARLARMEIARNKEAGGNWW
jgi:hypothetical protein